MNQIPSLAIDPLSLLAGVALGALAVAVWALPRFARLKQTQDTMGQTFEAFAQQSLRNSQEQFLQLAAEKLKQSQMEGIV
jgi:hypothetical protein